MTTSDKRAVAQDGNEEGSADRQRGRPRAQTSLAVVCHSQSTLFLTLFRLLGSSKVTDTVQKILHAGHTLEHNGPVCDSRALTSSGVSNSTMPQPFERPAECTAGAQVTLCSRAASCSLNADTMHNEFTEWYMAWYHCRQGQDWPNTESLQADGIFAQSSMKGRHRRGQGKHLHHLLQHSHRRPEYTEKKILKVAFRMRSTAHEPRVTRRKEV